MLLLHGASGNERDMIPLGRSNYPNSPIHIPRGKVLEYGMHRSLGDWRREFLTWRILNLEDGNWQILFYDASLMYSFELGKTIAVGFSNGANVGASLLLLEPRVISGALLFRPMVPFFPNNPLPDLWENKVIILSGEYDPIFSKKQA